MIFPFFFPFLLINCKFFPLIEIFRNLCSIFLFLFLFIQIDTRTINNPTESNTSKKRNNSISEILITPNPPLIRPLYELYSVSTLNRLIPRLFQMPRNLKVIRVVSYSWICIIHFLTIVFFTMYLLFHLYIIIINPLIYTSILSKNKSNIYNLNQSII